MTTVVPMAEAARGGIIVDFIHNGVHLVRPEQLAGLIFNFMRDGKVKVLRKYTDGTVTWWQQHGGNNTTTQNDTPKTKPGACPSC